MTLYSNRLGHLAIVAVLFLSGTAAAQAFSSAQNGVAIYPIRGLFLVDAKSGRKDLIEPAFRKALRASDRVIFHKEMLAAVKFATAKLTEDNKQWTLAASLQVTRAGFFSVRKSANVVDVYLPVTVGLHLTNVMDGSILFARTHTHILSGTLTAANAVRTSPRIAELYRDALAKVVRDAVTDLRDNFKPTKVSATVLDCKLSLAIIDKGLQNGIRTGDTLQSTGGEELSVLRVGKVYAVARPLLGKCSKGKIFSRYFSGNLAGFERPRVLPLIEMADVPMPDQALVSWLSDALGAAAPISLAPVNRLYADVLSTTAAQTDVSQLPLRTRAMPQWFLTLHVAKPTSYVRQTNLKYKTLRVTESLVWAEIVDVHGRVVAAAHGRDTLEDEITAGIKISNQARKEISVKNALLNLASKLGRTLRPRTVRLALEATGTGVQVQDPALVLAPIQTVEVLRPIAPIPGVNETVYIPVWEATARHETNGRVAISPNLPLARGAGPMVAGDIIEANLLRDMRAGAERTGVCGTASNLGSIAVEHYSALAFNLIAAASAKILYKPEIVTLVGDRVAPATGFVARAPLRASSLTRCVHMLSRIDPRPTKCTDNICSDIIRLRIGANLYRGDSPRARRIARKGLQTMLSVRALPKGSTESTRAAAIIADIRKEVIRLVPKILNLLLKAS